MSKKKMKYSKALVLAVVALNVLFTAAVLFVFLRTGNEPSMLVGAWFTFTTTELVSLCTIKNAKTKKGGGSDAVQNERLDVQLP